MKLNRVLWVILVSVHLLLWGTRIASAQAVNPPPAQAASGPRAERAGFIVGIGAGGGLHRFPERRGADTSQFAPVAAFGEVRADPGRLTVTLAEQPRPAFAISAAPEAAAPARRDSVFNGVLIGAGVGALVGLIPDHYDDCEECHDSLYASIGVGAGVGLLVDLLRGKSSAASTPGRQTSLLVGVGSRSARVRVAGVVRWR